MMAPFVANARHPTKQLLLSERMGNVFGFVFLGEVVSWHSILLFGFHARDYTRFPDVTKLENICYPL